MSPVELRRIIAEWRLRVSRVKNILQPPVWSEQQWRQFAQALALLVRDHGRSWIIDPNVYWDLRWKLQDGGELVCQVEHIPTEKTSLVVAQTGGFAVEVGSYTWLWAEFNMAGDFARDPYWVEGTWKEALTALLTPLDRQSSYLLAGRSETPAGLLTQEGARPNDAYFNLSLTEGDRHANGNGATQEPSEPAAWDGGYVPDGSEDQGSAPVKPPQEEYSSFREEAPATNGFNPPWEVSVPARPPNGRDGRVRRRAAHLRHDRCRRKPEPRSFRREFRALATMD
jgi:hypothetical protein